MLYAVKHSTQLVFFSTEITPKNGLKWTVFRESVTFRPKNYTGNWFCIFMTISQKSLIFQNGGPHHSNLVADWPYFAPTRRPIGVRQEITLYNADFQYITFKKLNFSCNTVSSRECVTRFSVAGNSLVMVPYIFSDWQWSGDGSLHFQWLAMVC